MSRITFLAPHLSLHADKADSPLAALRRASFVALAAADWAAWLAHHLGLTHLPAAALAALPGEASTSVEPFGSKPHKPRVSRHASLLIAEPVHLAVRNDGLVYTPLHAASISNADASSLVATLNHHFVHEGLKFCALAPHRWLVNCADSVDAQFVPAPRMPGASVFENVPVGTDAKRFRRVMTEAQMLLHDHAVNQSRATRRELAVNSIWLWGGGALPEPGGQYAHVVGDDPIAAGLALWMGASWSPRWPQRVPPGDVLVLALSEAGGELLLTSATQAVATGEHAQLDLIMPSTSQTRVWQLTTADRFKFWRHAPLPQVELASS